MKTTTSLLLLLLAIGSASGKDAATPRFLRQRQLDSLTCTPGDQIPCTSDSDCQDAWEAGTMCGNPDGSYPWVCGTCPGGDRVCQYGGGCTR